jgi:hypothetical protein
MPALDLKPVAMARSLPDTLISYLDEFEDQPLRPDKWPNIKATHNAKERPERTLPLGPFLHFPG